MKVPESYYDEIFEFNGHWDIPSRCGLRILDSGGKKIVIVTELYQENNGTSVTYAAGLLLAQICERKGLNMENVVYVECNPDTNSKLSFYDEEYFEVTFGRMDRPVPKEPKYRKLAAEEINSYFG